MSKQIAALCKVYGTAHRHQLQLGVACTTYVTEAPHTQRKHNSTNTPALKDCLYDMHTGSGGRTLPNASSMLAFFVTRLTKMGVRLEPSKSNSPLMKAAADICKAHRQHNNNSKSDSSETATATATVTDRPVVATAR